MAKAYRRKWYHHGCIIRQRGDTFQVEIHHNGKRERHSEPTLADAKTYAEQKSLELKNEGTSALGITFEQRIDATKALKLLPRGTLEAAIKEYADAVHKLDGIPLNQVVSFYLKHHKPIGGIRSVSTLLKEYIEVKKRENCRRRYISDIECRVGRFAKAFGDRHVHTITSAEIETWLDQNEYSGQSRINYLTVLMGFFNYARSLRLIESNPADKTAIRRPKLDERLPEIFSVKEVERLLHRAESKAKKIVPLLSIGFFAGVRSAEIEGLDWSDIDFVSKLITVRPEVAKKRRQRHVTMSDNLMAWLLPYRKQSGRISPADAIVRRNLQRVLSATKIKWVHNGMRHTFASCHLATFKDIGRTALELGHTGKVDVLFNHYRNLVKPADAEAYWNIYPKKEAKVLPFATVS